MSKHTAGEWSFAADSYGKVQHSRKACVYTVIPGKDGERIVNVAQKVPNWADARLMAAAKDLLQVARGALGYLEALPESCRPDDAWLKPLRAAIRKAVSAERSEDAS